MSNATDTYEYITSAFAALRAQLAGVDDDAEISKRIRLNTAAREAARLRAVKEYATLDLIPPSDIALSITARRLMAEIDAGQFGELPADEPAREVG